jgi:hypothetical protein
MSEPSVEQRLDAVIRAVRDSKVSRAQIEATLAAFTDRHGLPRIVFGTDNLVPMTVGEDLEVALSQPEGLPGVLAVALMPTDPGQPEKLARLLLQLNMSWADTGGGIFALLPPEREIHFCKQILVTPGDADAFERDFMGFLELARDWQCEIQLLADLPEGAPAGPPSEPAAMVVPDELV